MSTSDFIHIAGLMVHAMPDRLEAVMSVLEESGAIRLARSSVPGKCAAVIECASERELGSCIERLQNTPGVIGVSMTSHYIEDASALAEVAT